MIFTPDNLAVAPWAHLDLLVAVVGALGLVGSSAGFWEWRKFRRKQKISADEQETAAAARAIQQQPEETPAEELVGAAMTIVEQWKTMVESINDRHDKEMEKRDRRHAADVKALGKRLDNEASKRKIFERTIHQWWLGMSRDWERVRQQPYAPNFPEINYDKEEEV